MRFIAALTALAVTVSATVALAAPLRRVPEQSVYARDDLPESLTARDTRWTLNKPEKRVDGVDAEAEAKRKAKHREAQAKHMEKPKTGEQIEAIKASNRKASAKYTANMTPEQKAAKQAGNKVAKAKFAAKPRTAEEMQAKKDAQKAATARWRAAKQKAAAAAPEAGPAPPPSPPPPSPPPRPITPVTVAVNRGTANPQDIFGPR
ncbi:hypothetical protein EIP91_001746 [Steccherinum ochraceum]|uniref:Uncharacterized protein n=1 Tax=Steccherinum ochraceum TaxID=92696 RepID=A0A4V2MWG2_9APHY|nr:hypothetical protein EIP91_001746 [Steccherinum ochraceum]